MGAALASKLKANIREVPNFPKPGINFYDVTSLMNDGAMLAAVTAAFRTRYAEMKIDAIAGIDARGFVFGAAAAHALGIGFIPVRKAGKLPPEVEQISYTLEYGEGKLEIHRHAVKKGMRIVVLDDLLATGGTARGAADLIRRLGGEVIECAFVVELTFLDGRKLLPGCPIHSLVQYDS
jgi:adenine phosphoribosyltransferase